jgi:hypothetical protein
LDRALEASVWCPLRRHGFCRWGDGADKPNPRRGSGSRFVDDPHNGKAAGVMVTRRRTA